MRIVALVPARFGSARCPGKNTRTLAGRPLLAHMLLAAYHSNVFATVIVASDDAQCLSLAREYEAEPFDRDAVTGHQPDIAWIREVFANIDPRCDVFAILRPTSPFRTADTIRRAVACFKSNDCADSIRAVEPVTQTPYKMWTWPGPGYPIAPLLEGEANGAPYHSSPTQVCPPVYIQNSSLEIAWTRNVEVYGTIHGRKVAPFFTEGYEGFSIDTEDDWQRAERLVQSGHVTLPSLSRPIGGVSAAAETQQAPYPRWSLSRGSWV